MLICKVYNIDADGIFGKITDAKIREYQKANGLVVDGKVWRNTFGELVVRIKSKVKTVNKLIYIKLLTDELSYCIIIINKKLEGVNFRVKNI